MIKLVLRFVFAWFFLPVALLLMFIEWLMEDLNSNYFFYGWLSWATFDWC